MLYRKDRNPFRDFHVLRILSRFVTCFNKWYHEQPHNRLNMLLDAFSKHPAPLQTIVSTVCAVTVEVSYGSVLLLAWTVMIPILSNNTIRTRITCRITALPTFLKTGKETYGWLPHKATPYMTIKPVSSIKIVKRYSDSSILPAIPFSGWGQTVGKNIYGPMTKARYISTTTNKISQKYILWQILTWRGFLSQMSMSIPSTTAENCMLRISIHRLRRKYPSLSNIKDIWKNIVPEYILTTMEVYGAIHSKTAFCYIKRTCRQRGKK